MNFQTNFHQSIPKKNCYVIFVEFLEAVSCNPVELFIEISLYFLLKFSAGALENLPTWILPGILSRISHGTAMVSQGT